MGNELNNIKIVKGDSIPKPSGKYYSYQFTYCNFSDYESRWYDEDPASEQYSSGNYAYFRKEMDKSKSFLWIHPISKHYNYLPMYGKDSMIGAQNASLYANKPCGIRTKSGSIIPQIIIPWGFFSSMENGILSYDEEIALKKNPLLIGKEATLLGYNWHPMSTTKDNNLIFDEEQTIDALDRSSSGRRINAWWVSNEKGLKTSLDSDYIATRKYYCVTDGSYLSEVNNAKAKLNAAGLGDNLAYNKNDSYTYSLRSGAFAICYRFVHSNKQEFNSSDSDSVAVSPKLLIELPTNKFDVFGVRTTSDAQLAIAIAESGDISVVCGNQKSHGTLKANSRHDILPMQCQINNRDEFELEPIFVYPTFNGVVVTNSVVDSFENNDNQIFVKYSNASEDIRSCARINNVIKSEQIKQMIKNDPDSEMSFFPTLVQENGALIGEGAPRIELDRTNHISFGNSVDLSWIRSVGRFAYAPIYFFRDLEFTVFFKAKYANGDEAPGDYYFYPLASANTSKIGTDSRIWTGIDENGAAPVKATYICSDNELMCGYYRADFKYECAINSRYPIEIFSAAMVYHQKGYPLNFENANGRFKYTQTFQEQFSYLFNNFNEDNNYLSLLKTLDLSFTMDGATGSMTLDSYPVQRDLGKIRHDQSIGEVDLAIVDKHGEKHNLFSGFGHSIQTNDGEGNYSVGVTLEGIQRKANDIKLVCCPLWDGDRLDTICSYLEDYANIKVKMVNYKVSKLSEAKSIDYDNLYTSTGGWRSSGESFLKTDYINHDFRVPHSYDWHKPSVDFKTGTTITEAFNKLGEFTSCKFVFQSDGVGYFFELNNHGYPYYVDNQIKNKTYVEFAKEEVVSVTLSPNLQVQYNSFSTMGFLQTRQKKGHNVGFEMQNDIEPGHFFNKVKSDFPWARMHVGVENGYQTRSELKMMHNNKIKFSRAAQYSGTISVAGNTKVDHIYQCIKISGMYFFVTSISHSISLESKSWTTSYGASYIDFMD